ncbi:SUMO-activating enzyme subunit 2 [Daktulosphaira vitifoliae]|uniref:SUMO-activating enzyme subunit 2 n=1 Tax=Daktulosphaira vitifoliae TaxID=58002 RepID=UPI0021AA0212|nr:SUMO-activating enzyme subunit 2 [Daktulosphaira vitifoliae]
MAANIVGVFHPEMQNLIKNSKILLVGAGGIGCEVLKNLVLTGFSDIEVIDLDTIDVSNLNRQFLFNKDSVGKAKSHVAKESVLRFNPNVNINSHLGDIMDKKYGAAFFKKFKLIINALDNRKARNHVNRMCISVDVPLIESGTLGYHGQVELIKKGMTQCYECVPKSEPKSFPMCTIRNTPKEPIHCIIWAKFLFGQLFGEMEEDVSMDEKGEGESKVSARQWAKSNNYDPIKLFKKFFIDDIQYLLSMEDLYKNKGVRPVPFNEDIIKNIEESKYKNEPDTVILSLEQYVVMFLDCVTSIKEKFLKSNEFLVWDKDDDDYMNFVVACTNIRSKIFNIVLKSHFDIKSMAGNIIPAIATANAMVGGQIVIHALRILRGQFERCQTVYLREMPNHKGLFMVRDKKLSDPNKKCAVCTNEGQIILSTDINTFTVRQLDDLVLKKKLNVVAPDVLLNTTLIISNDEDDELDLYSKTLEEVGVRDGSRMVVQDYFQDYKIKIDIHHKEKVEEEDPDFEVFGNLDELKKAEQEKNDNNDENESDNEDCIMELPEGSEEIKNNSVVELDIDNDDVVEVGQGDELPIKRKCADFEENLEPKKIKINE